VGTIGEPRSPGGGTRKGESEDGEGKDVKTTRSDSWQRFVEDPRAAEHGVQVYEDDSELAEAVGRYLAAGFRAGAPAVVIATAEHGARFAEALEAEGLDPAALAAQGQLTVRDSHETLATLMEGDAPSPLRFERIIGGLIDEVSARFPDETIRAFGDMVDVLSERGQREAALALEELWNGLARTGRFALFCSYRLDIFDLEVQALTLPSVFEAHSVARPSVDPARLAAAVDRAVAEVAGARELARIYLTVAEHAPRGGLPRAQALLGWLSTSNPRLAGRVFERVRLHYRRTPTTRRLSGGRPLQG
jgi:DcmR-like sensory protein